MTQYIGANHDLAMLLLASFVVILLFSALAWAVARQHQSRDYMAGEVVEGQADVDAMRNALTDWLQEQRIVRAMVTTKTASFPELQVTLLAVPAMRREQLESTCHALLRDKAVRRVIAAYVSHRHGLQVGLVLKGLLDWAKPIPMRSVQ